MHFLLIPILCTGLLFGNISYAFAQNETVIIPSSSIGPPITLTFDSPLKQFKAGILIDEIKCNEDLFKIRSSCYSTALSNMYFLQK